MTTVPCRGSDFLQLDPSTAPRGGLTAWLTRTIRDAIVDGRLGPGTPVPSTRRLADDLGVSRGVVVEAFQQLTSEGLLGARQGSGTAVLAHAPACPADRSRGDHRSWPGGRSETLRRSIGDLSAEVDLVPELVDAQAFPREAWLRAERRALRTAAALHLDDVGGSEPLRRAVAGWLNRQRAMAIMAADVVIVTGVTQAVALLARALVEDGHRRIGVENPGHSRSAAALGPHGLRPVPVPVDGQGVSAEALRRHGLRLVLATPAHQFPTGVALSPERRAELLDWAADVDGLVIEDDRDAELRYERGPVPPLQPRAPERVAYVGGVPPSIASGLPLGWLVPPPHLQQAVLCAKRSADAGMPALVQLALAELMESGGYDRHLRSVRGRHRTRRDVLLAALSERLPSAQVAGFAGGVHLAVTFPRLALDDVHLAERLARRGVRTHPLSWHHLGARHPGLVLGYAAAAPEQLPRAVSAIADAVAELS